jgi:hypothetical protein
MRIAFLSIFILLFTACGSTTKPTPSKEKSTQEKILNNQSTAVDAQDEYKKLQALRNKD